MLALVLGRGKSIALGGVLRQGNGEKHGSGGCDGYVWMLGGIEAVDVVTLVGVIEMYEMYEMFVTREKHDCLHDYLRNYLVEVGRLFVVAARLDGQWNDASDLVSFAAAVVVVVVDWNCDGCSFGRSSEFGVGGVAAIVVVEEKDKHVDVAVIASVDGNVATDQMTVDAYVVDVVVVGSGCSHRSFESEGIDPCQDDSGTGQTRIARTVGNADLRPDSQ